MKRDATTVANWNFQRIIPCHGVSKIACICLCETDLLDRTSLKMMAIKFGEMFTRLSSIDLSLIPVSLKAELSVADHNARIYQTFWNLRVLTISCRYRDWLSSATEPSNKVI